MDERSKNSPRRQGHRVERHVCVVADSDLAIARNIKALIEDFPAPLFEQLLLEIDLVFPGVSFCTFFVAYMLALQERGQQ